MVQNHVLLSFLPNLVMYFLDQLGVLCQGRETPQSKEKNEDYWHLETLGMKDNEPTLYEKFIEDIRDIGDRYEVKLPFKEGHSLLPDNCHNYQLSKIRLESLSRGD